MWNCNSTYKKKFLSCILKRCTSWATKVKPSTKNQTCRKWRSQESRQCPRKESLNLWSSQTCRYGGKGERDRGKIGKTEAGGVQEGRGGEGKQKCVRTLCRAGTVTLVGLPKNQFQGYWEWGEGYVIPVLLIWCEKSF